MAVTSNERPGLFRVRPSISQPGLRACRPSSDPISRGRLIDAHAGRHPGQGSDYPIQKQAALRGIADKIVSMISPEIA